MNKKQVKYAEDTFGQSWEMCKLLDGVAQLSRKRGEDVLMVMKMAKSTPVLINGGSFCAPESSRQHFRDFVE